MSYVKFKNHLIVEDMNTVAVMTV